MKVHVSDATPRLKRAVTQLLLDTFDTDSGELWLVTPWLKDVELDLESFGDYASVFGEQRRHTTLVELLELLGRRHLVHVVTKPPHELVDLSVLHDLAGQLEMREKLTTQPEFEDFELHEALIKAQNAAVQQRRREFLTHADTVQLGARLARAGVRVYYRNDLHAKLLWAPAGALFGSANFTNGGLSKNAELVAEVYAEDDHAALKDAAERLASEASQQDRYDLGDRRAVPRWRFMPFGQFTRLANLPGIGDDEQLQPLLETLSHLYLTCTD